MSVNQAKCHVCGNVPKKGLNVCRPCNKKEKKKRKELLKKSRNKNLTKEERHLEWATSKRGRASPLMVACMQADMAASYAVRNTNLKSIGYADYKQYLAGKLWKSIRKSVLSKTCQSCSSPASQVHHLDYTVETLLGKNPEKLVSLCAMCHKHVEFNRDGSKRTVEQAARRCLLWVQQKADKEEARMLARLHDVDKNGEVVLTHKLIHAGKSDDGEWKVKQIQCLGIGWPPRRGWIKTLIGKKVTEETILEFFGEVVREPNDVVG